MESAFPRGWRLLRSMIPPWGNRLNDPLLSHEVRPQRRAGGRPVGFLIISVLIGTGLIAYLTVNVFSKNFTSTQQQIEELLTILMMGLTAMSILGHWRLLLATVSRSSALIAQKRERGDWALIYITPVSKSRWFRAQFTALGWQIFPLVRRLMIVQFLMAVIAFPGLIILQNEQYTRVSGALYGIELLIFAALVVVEPIFTAGIFASSAMLESSIRRRAWTSFANSLSMVYAVRVVITLVMQIAGLIFLIILSPIFSEGSLDEIPGEAFLYVCIYCIVSSLVLAFFLEWLPAVGAILLSAPYDTKGNFYALSWLILTLSVSHILTPIILMGMLEKRSIRRLLRPER